MEGDFTDWLIDREECVEELRKKVKELEKENTKLKIVRFENDYGYENIHFITKNNLISIDTNKYLIEIEENKFVDLKQVYLDNKNSIPKQKIKNKIEELKDRADGIAGTYQYADSQEHLQEKKDKVIELRTKAEGLQELLQEEGK